VTAAAPGSGRCTASPHARTGSAVDTTIVDGQILMRGRELLTMDEPQVLSEANAGFLRTLEKIRS
jgi:5-methylthioadenosine/S-adenosylhomocysteine deaminase